MSKVKCLIEKPKKADHRIHVFVTGEYACKFQCYPHTILSIDRNFPGKDAGFGLWVETADQKSKFEMDKATVDQVIDEVFRATVKAIEMSKHDVSATSA